MSNPKWWPRLPYQTLLEAEMTCREAHLYARTAVHAFVQQVEERLPDVLEKQEWRVLREEAWSLL